MAVREVYLRLRLYELERGKERMVRLVCIRVGVSTDACVSHACLANVRLGWSAPLGLEVPI